MSQSHAVVQRLDPEVLAEQWFAFQYRLLGALQERARELSAMHITQKHIAARLGKQPAVISRCLRGRENMTMRTMHDLARAMDCRIDITVQPLSGVQLSNKGPGYQDPFPQPAALGGPRQRGATADASNSYTARVHIDA